MGKRKQKFSSFGGLPLTAIIIPACLLAVAFVLYTAGAPGAVTQISAAANHLALRGIQAYATSECPEKIANCHNYKVNEALVAVDALMQRNSHLFGSTGVSATTGQGLYLEPLRYYPAAPSDGSMVIGCKEFPCLIAPGDTELANSIRISGVVEDNDMINFFSNIFGLNQPIKANVKSVAHMVALEMMLVLDYSLSMQTTSHLDPDDGAENISNPGGSPTPPDDLETPVPPPPVPSPSPWYYDSENKYRESGYPSEVPTVPPSFTRLDPGVWDMLAKVFWSDEKGDLALEAKELIKTEPLNGEEEPSIEIEPSDYLNSPAYTDLDGIPSFFAWSVGESLPGSIDPLFQPYWDAMPDTLTTPDDDYPTYQNPLAHAKDDFTLEVKTYGPSHASWSSYPELYRDRHPDPSSVDNPTIFLPQSGGDNLYYYIDGHTQANKTGPEPFRSAMAATQELLNRLAKRQVPEDRFGLIFYSHYLPWTSVIQISNDLSYPRGLIDSMLSGPGGDFLALEPRRLDDPTITDYATDFSNTPLFYQLGLFPKAGHYTNPMIAYIQAVQEFNSIPGDLSSVRAIIDVSDGVLNCVQYNGSGGAPRWGFPRCQDVKPDGPPYPEHCFFYFGDFACRDNYYGYYYGNDALDDFTRNILFRSGISLNVAQFGSPGPGGPHYLLKETKDGSGGSRCMTDAEARSLSTEFVQGQPFSFDALGFSDLGEGAYNYKSVQPFWQAAADTYNRVKMTGGIYAPIMPGVDENGGTCGEEPDCEGASGNERMAYDWQCRTVEQQMADAFTNIVDNSEAYSLLDPNL